MEVAGAAMNLVVNQVHLRRATYLTIYKAKTQLSGGGVEVVDAAVNLIVNQTHPCRTTRLVVGGGVEVADAAMNLIVNQTHWWWWGGGSRQSMFIVSTKSLAYTIIVMVKWSV